MTILSIDFETASTCDLKRAGAWVYSKHPDTRVLCMAWAFDDEPVVVWRPDAPFPKRVLDHIQAGGEVHAWNALFEFCIWNNCLWRNRAPSYKVRLEQLHCSMARAAYYGLPMGLDMAGPASGANVFKDKVGHALMKRMSRPRTVKPTLTWWHKTDALKYDRLCDYCLGDVNTERAVAATLPPLPDFERLIWLMDARMNLRGLKIDRELVVRLMAIADAEVDRLSRELEIVTGGVVKSVTKVAALTRWLIDQGYDFVSSLAKDSMGDLLSDPRIQGDARRALLIRQEAAKTSTAKLVSMLDCADPHDDRVRGLVMHYGAIRTGRWAGRLVQVQNLPRPSKRVNVELFIQHVLDGLDIDTLRFVHGNLLDAVASSLRGCFVADTGKAFAVCDYSAVEARVIAWLAGQLDLLDVFRSGQDVYVYTAGKIGSTDRTLGKVATLGLGFGMGWVKFIESAKVYGLTLSEELAQSVVQAWRQANRHIVAFWHDLEQAARDAIRFGHETQVGHVTVRMGRGKLTDALLIWLPSGRPLVYRRARLETVDGRSQVTYDGLDQYTRQWKAIRTYGGKLAENVTQAVARDLLADAMLRTEEAALDLVASIHDEELAEVDAVDADDAFNEMKAIMSTGPAWSVGLPLGGAGFTGLRYGKG